MPPLLPQVACFTPLKKKKMLWTGYRFKKEDYDRLIRVLRQPNKYRYGVLLEQCGLKGSPCRFKAVEVPEGVLLLSRNQKVKGVGELLDLKEYSLKLTCYTLYIPADSERIRLQVRRDYLKLLLHRIRALNSAYWYGSKRKFVRDYLKAVNEIVREANDLCSTCFVYPATIQSFNRALKRLVYQHLTSVQGLKSRRAKEVIRSYLTVLRH